MTSRRARAKTSPPRKGLAPRAKRARSSAYVGAVLLGSLLAPSSHARDASPAPPGPKEKAPPREPAPSASPFSDWRQAVPGRRHLIGVEALPPPHATASVDNGPHIVPRPAKAWPRAPAGFTVTLYAQGLRDPRLLRVSPAGDVFVSESRPGVITLLRGQGHATEITSFATGLDKPFGLAFYPPGAAPNWLYVGETDAVVRFPYRVGDRKARGPKEVIARLPSGGWLRGGGHWTRDLVFSADGKTLFV